MHRDSFIRSLCVYAFVGLLAWVQAAVADGWVLLSSRLGYFQKLGSVAGNYYVTTASVIRPGVPGTYEAYFPLKSREIEPGYIVYYKDGDEIDALLPRIRRNIAAIRKAGFYTIDDERSIQFSYGPLPLGNFSEMMDDLCHFSLPLDMAATAETMVYGLRISNEQICVGYGALAATAGFDVVTDGKTLALKAAGRH